MTRSKESALAQAALLERHFRMPPRVTEQQRTLRDRCARAAFKVRILASRELARRRARRDV